MSATTIKAHFDEPIERPANVDAETGEIYDPIEDEARMLGEGSN